MATQPAGQLHRGYVLLLVVLKVLVLDGARRGHSVIARHWVSLSRWGEGAVSVATDRPLLLAKARVSASPTAGAPDSSWNAGRLPKRPGSAGRRRDLGRETGPLVPLLPARTPMLRRDTTTAGDKWRLAGPMAVDLPIMQDPGKALAAANQTTCLSFGSQDSGPLMDDSE